jgi:Mitochondrial carrier protein
MQAMHVETRGCTLGMIDTFRDIYKHEGPRGYWRGLTASLLGLSHVAIQVTATATATATATITAAHTACKVAVPIVCRRMLGSLGHA